jgi:hypothetical protein
MSRTTIAAVWPPTAAVAARAGHKPMSPMQAIRRKCLDCSGSQIAEVRFCEAITCSLWPFRAGRHPYTKTRVLEAISDGHALDGTPVAQKALCSPIGLQDASFGEREPIAVHRSGDL